MSQAISYNKMLFTHVLKCHLTFLGRHSQDHSIVDSFSANLHCGYFFTMPEFSCSINLHKMLYDTIENCSCAWLHISPATSFSFRRKCFCYLLSGEAILLYAGTTAGGLGKGGGVTRM